MAKSTGGEITKKGKLERTLISSRLGRIKYGGQLRCFHLCTSSKTKKKLFRLKCGRILHFYLLMNKRFIHGEKTNLGF